MRFTEFKDESPDMMQAFKDFLPIVMQELELEKLPVIKLVKIVKDPSQPTFGKFVNDEETIYLGMANRHPIDILRTLAHELVHFKQFITDNLPRDAGHTGSPQENEAHVKAGIIMRHFDKKYPHYFKDKPIEFK